MSIWDSLKSALSSRVEKAMEQQKRSEGKGSCLSSGRMKETDKIKGKDSPLPKEPGMYRHRDKETGSVDYVGTTTDLRKRQQEHERNGKLDTEKQYVQYKTSRSGANQDDLYNTEKSHIARHNPSGNTTVGGNGRRRKED